MHRIETAPTGRAVCRGCKQRISKGAIRFAEEFQNPYSEEGGTSFRYWHLPCAATALANEVGDALSCHQEPIADREAIEALVRENRRPEMPFAERAGSGRARCRACDRTIKKGELRLAFERVYDSPMGPQKGAAYVHPPCLGRYLDREHERGRGAPAKGEAMRCILANSRLPDEELRVVDREMRGDAPRPLVT